MGIPISAIVITFNEEQNILRCLNSLADIADEVIVVDSYSTDNTVKIATEFGAKVYQQVFLGHVEQKNFALSKATNNYILSLDADEVVSDKLKESILKVKENWTHDGYYFNRLTNYCGKWIKHTSWYPSRKLRLWDKQKGSWGGVNPHDKLIMKRGASKTFIKGDLLHYSYYSTEQHYKKVASYSQIFAESHFLKGNKAYKLNIFLNPFWRFFRDYFIKLGFLDGKDGLTICRISAYETYLKYRKLYHLNLDNKNIKGDICFFNGNKDWGGGEKWYFDIACRLIKRDYKVVAVANRHSDLLLKFRLKKVPAFSVSLNNLSFFNPITIFKLVRFFKRSGIRTLIINLSSDLKTAGIAAKLAGVEKVIYRRGSAIPLKNSILNRFIFKHLVTEVIANSEETKRTILQNNANLIDHSKIHVIYNGIELTENITSDINNKELVIGNCGRLSPEKGQMHLIYLAKKLMKKEIPFRILIAGAGKLEADLKKQAIKEGVSNNVIFLGFLSDLKDFYQNIDIYVLTSKWEGFGFVLVEAMSFKKPVVAFDINSSSEIVVDSESGFLVERENVEKLEEKILELYYNEELRKKMGVVGRKIVEEKFTISSSLKKIEELIVPKSKILNQD